MQFELTDEQQQFADALRKWAERAYGFEHRQRVVRSPAGVDAADWAALAELGLTALGVPSDLGGLEAGGIEHLVAMQETGRVLLAEPLFSTLWGSAFLRMAGGHQDLLTRIAAGQLRLACAVQEVSGRHEVGHVECRATPAGDGGWRLVGAKNFVLHGAQADVLVVSARTAGGPQDHEGISLFVVQADAVGLACRDCATIDGQRAATVTLEDVVVPASALLGEAGQGWPILDAACDFGVTLLCAEAIGVMEALLHDTLQYLGNRQQFGVPIAKFQALQHRMADVFIHTEQARSLAWLAAAKVGCEDAAERRRCVSAAKARIGEALRFVGQQAVQLHGGLGVSDEMRVSHLFRRATMIEFTLGDTDHHVSRFAAQPGFVPA